MIDARLQVRLTTLETLRRRARVWRRVAVCWWIAAAALLVIHFGGVVADSLRPKLALGVLVGGFFSATAIWLLERRRSDDFKALVTRLEHEHPELHPLLATAFEQNRDPESREFNFLQQRVIEQALRHPSLGLARATLEKRLLSAKAVHVLGMAAVVLLMSLPAAPYSKQPSKSWFAESMTIEPGDVELERGTSLVITIRFDRQPPNEATLVLTNASGGIRRIPLERHLDDPLFGTSLREVMENGAYHIEYGRKRTRDYRIRVFEYPALVRADAALEFPAYTGLTNREIPDTLRISAVEGSRLDYRFRLNKPVAKARLVSKEQTLALATGTNELALLDHFVLTNSGKFALQLIDHEGRTNRRSVEIVLQALPNRIPDLKLNFPRGDQRVSKLQELRLEGEVLDDFGVVKYGLGYGVAGQEPQLIELGSKAGRNEKRPLQYEIDIEKLALEADQVISYFAWADDIGPAGDVRRTFGDMFFAEIRPFDEIFRADQSGADGGAQEGQGGQQGGGGGEQTRLTELQKQIVIATWKMQREKGAAPAAVKP